MVSAQILPATFDAVPIVRGNYMNNKSSDYILGKITFSYIFNLKHIFVIQLYFVIKVNKDLSSLNIKY